MVLEELQYSYILVTILLFEGWLCGECNQCVNSSKRSGIGVLTEKCRCSEDEMYYYLVPLVGKC